MKGKRRERLMALALIFAMTAGMIAEPVRISAAQEYSSKVSEQNGVTEAYTVSGQILSGGTAVSGAAVQLGDFAPQVTDKSGAYSVREVPNGTYNLTVSRNGFERYESSVTVSGTEVTNADAVLCLTAGSVGIANSDIVVGERTEVSYRCDLSEGEIQSVLWQSGDAATATVENGIVTGVKAGKTTITPTITSVYGDVPMTETEVTVGECGTEMEKMEINKAGIFKNKLNIDVTVKALAGESTPTGGDVEFKIKQMGVKDDIAEEAYTKPLENGKAQLQLAKKNFDFSGEYLITAAYKGHAGYYAESGAKTESYNYEISGLEYEDETGKITSHKERPLTLTYGEQKTIWVSEENSAANEVFSNVSDKVNIVKQEQSGKAGYTEFTITAKNTGKCDIVFKRTADGEKIYPYLYVEVKPKELNIDTDKEKSYMVYSKIYDDNKDVFVNADTKDIITLERMNFDLGVIGGDTVSVDLAAAADIKGILSGEFDGNVTDGRETQITFNQNQLKLQNDNGNYVLADKEIQISAKAVILKRPVTVKVSDAERSFGHAYHNGIGNGPDYIFHSDDWVDVQTGTGEGIEGIIEKGYRDPSSETALTEEQADGNTAKPDTYEKVLSIDTAKMDGIQAENYDFRIEKGTLTVKEEEINDIFSYINFENFKENPTIYMNDKKELWVKADKGKLELNTCTEKLYDEVLLTKVGETALSPSVSLTGEGYVFDRADVEESEEISLTLRLKNQQGVYSKEFSYHIYLDNTIPEVFISEAEGSETPLGDFVNKISFGLFGKTEYKVKVKVTETDTSGLKEWTYMVLPLKKDMVNGTDKVSDADNLTEEEITKSRLLQYIETLKDSGEYVWQPANPSGDLTEIIIDRKDTGEDFAANHYVVLVKPYDNVKNSKIYTSLGIILDNNEPYVDLGLDYEGGQVYREVYNDDVKLHVSVTDNNHPADKTVSGLREIYYQVAVGRENLEKAERVSLYNAEKGKKYTLEELQNEVLQRNITISKKWNSNDIWVGVTAVDNSGNEYQAFQHLKIDMTKPEVSVKYETKATEDYAPYYNRDRTVLVAVRERNVDVNSIKELWFDLQREGEQKSAQYTLSSMGAIEGITVESVKDSQEGQNAAQYTDDRIIEMRIRFHGDNKYDFDVHCADKGDWEEEQDNSTYFVIDKTAPELSVAYGNADGTAGVAESEQSRFYSGKPMTAKVEIKEHNFAYADKDVPIEVKVTADKVGEGEEIPDYTALEKTNSLDVWNKNVDTYTSMYVFRSDANYIHSIVYTDLAGNAVSYGPGCFTVDKTNPTGTVKIKGLGFWESLLEKITFGLFSPSAVDTEVTGADHTSPVAPVQYTRVQDQMTRDELEAYNGWSSASEDRPDYAGFSVNPDEQFIVYTKVTDYAGNYQFFSSDGMIADGTKPGPVVAITNLSQSQNGIFHEDVTLQIDVEDPTVGDTYSGLEKVWYTVSAAGNVNTSETIELLDNSRNRIQGNKTFSQVITVPASEYNSNDVKVQAFAQDFSGNKGNSDITELKIDVTNPTVSVAWDLNNPSNGKYYKDTRTATVTVTDRNFDANNVRFNITNTDGTEANISGWSSSSDMGISDSAASTCQVSFPADGDYTFTLGCTDLAGNGGEYGKTDAFTIDKTNPVLTVSYDNSSARNGRYFKETRTATVTVREHNFNPADVRTAVTAALQGCGISPPSISGFSDSGDIHTATVRYAADGDYTFDIDYTDMAGNQAADYTPDCFTVDLTKPEVEITDIKDKSANNDVVAPGVKATDANYDAGNVTITVTGANNGKVDIGKVVSAVENGQSIKMNDFAREEKMDDLYTLTAKSVDKAGNETEKSVLFSVNRYGSVYVLDDATREDKGGWLSTKNHTYIRKEQELGVMEYNIDTIESGKITVDRDGKLTILKENQDYTVKSTGSDTQWKENHYILSAANFSQEGNYNVIFNTRDRANNTMNNTSVKKSNKNLPIEFTVDKTAPTVVVSGVEDGGHYRQAEKHMTADVKDNLALARVNVCIDGERTVYSADELREVNGIIKTTVPSANSWQEIEITSEDEAGNQLGETKEKDKAQSVVMKILVTPNLLIQYYMNKPLFYGSIATVVMIAGVIGFLARRKKKETA